MEDENMKIENIIISILLFSTTITILMGAAVFMADKYTEMGYPMSIDTSSTEVFNKISAINEQTARMQSVLLSNPSNFLTAIGAFLYAAWSALLTSFGILPILTSLILDVVAILGIPGEIATFLIGAAVISLVFTIIYIVFNSGNQ
jgi:hypothetical protein